MPAVEIVGAEMESDGFRHRLRISARIDSGEPIALGAVYLANPRNPCGVGAPARLMLIDGEPRDSGRPVALGAHADIELVFTYHEVERIVESETALDFQVVEDRGPRCVRVEVTDGTVAWDTSRTGSFPFAFEISGAGKPLAGSYSVWSFSAGHARWVGPLRIGVRAGIGAVRCAADTCEPTLDEETKKPSNQLGLSLPAGVFGDSFPFRSGQVGSVVGMRYRTLWNRLPTRGGDEWRILHDLSLRLGFTVSDPPAQGSFAAGPAGGTVEGALTAGAWLAPDGSAAPAFGFGLEFDFVD